MTVRIKSSCIPRELELGEKEEGKKVRIDNFSLTCRGSQVNILWILWCANGPRLRIPGLGRQGND